jgi:hypothetical protein
MMHEDKQAICDAFCATLRLTNNAGHPEGNPLKELKYIPEREIVRPIFEDGTGSDGWYDCYVGGDSGTAMITDIVRQFVQKVW